MKLRVLYVMLVLLLAAGGYCGYRYYLDALKPEQELDTAAAAQEEIIERIRPVVDYTDLAVSDLHNDTSESDKVNSVEDNAENPLAPCEAVNDDTVGWIYIPDTNIDLPIVQGTDNDFYLHNGVDKAYNYELGCPFLDYKCKSDFSGFNSIVFAHHMTKRRMFADISLFKDEGFMNSHSEGYLTLADGVHTVSFFAYLNVPSTANVYQTEFVSDEDREAYLEYIRDTADYVHDMDVNIDSHLLLLSTCTYEFDEARGLLVGVIG